MRPPLRPRRRRELPVEALRPASSVPRLRTRGRLNLVQQPAVRRTVSPLLALALAVSAHAGLAWWGLYGPLIEVRSVAIRDATGATLHVSVERPTPRPSEPAPRRTRLVWPEAVPSLVSDGASLPEAPAAPAATPVLAQAPQAHDLVARPWLVHAPGARPTGAAGEPPSASAPSISPELAAEVERQLAELQLEDAPLVAERAVAAQPVQPTPEAPPQPSPELAEASSSGGHVTRPEPLADNPAPHYPAMARRRGWHGRVVVRVQVSAVGDVLHAEVANSSAHKVLENAALSAVRRWRFEPARDERGVAVPAEREVSVRFHFDEGTGGDQVSPGP